MRSLPYRAAFLVLAHCVVGIALGATGSGAASIYPTLRHWIDLGPSEKSVPVWVFFADRGFQDEAAHRAALAAAQQRIGEAALARRSRVGASLADDCDLSVHAAYVDAIARIGQIRHESRWLNGVSANIRLGDIGRVANLPFVVEIRPVAVGRSAGFGPARAPDGRLLERPDPSRAVQGAAREAPSTDAIPSGFGREVYGPSYGQLNEIGVVQSQGAGFSGARVILEMIDSGFRKDHDAFGLARKRILGEYDFVFHDGETQNQVGDDPSQDWHGTATWSTSGGFSPGNIVGPAYGSTFVLAKTEDIRSETRVEEDNYVAALEWGDSLGVEVTSASLIYTTFDDGTGWTWNQLDGHTAPISRAIDRAADIGILCVNAMGNYGPAPRTLGEPADADSMLACGAVDSLDTIASFSSRGPTVDGRTKPEVDARGVDTWAANANEQNGYLPVSGTSLSTPLVGGSCAIVLEAHPEWSAFRARSALSLTADRATHPDNDYGSGRINVWAAIHQTPLLYPYPFSLLTPGNGDSAVGQPVRFVWNRTNDPRGGNISYEVWVDDAPDFGSPIVYPGIADTTFTLPVSLQTGTFHWRVYAEERQGHRRLSREDRVFHTTQPADSNGPVIVSTGWRLTSAPNPVRGSACTLRWYAPPGSRTAPVVLTILDPVGRRLFREGLTVDHEGWNETQWNGLSDEGKEAPSGVYLVLLNASGRVAKAKIVLTR
jgi:hypothetical protein